MWTCILFSSKKAHHVPFNRYNRAANETIKPQRLTVRSCLTKPRNQDTVMVPTTKKLFLPPSCPPNPAFEACPSHKNGSGGKKGGMRLVIIYVFSPLSFIMALSAIHRPSPTIWAFALAPSERLVSLTCPPLKEKKIRKKKKKKHRLMNQW